MASSGRDIVFLSICAPVLCVLSEKNVFAWDDPIAQFITGDHETCERLLNVDTQYGGH